ncbi:Uncharacterized protein TCM_003542 [Theobroma cacao]|uniref:Uncharacterized protein n=1 Tax=Theobroma cacao TaxID=3641 RepID=A0A061DND7_THECC|nr:Uncharacterized protein TCM_003542 [Theobroma cacao]
MGGGMFLLFTYKVLIFFPLLILSLPSIAKPISGDKENEIDLNKEVYQENDVSISINITPSEDLDIPIVLTSGDYEEFNVLIEDKEDDMEEDGEELEDQDEETFRMMVKGKHSKPRPRAPNASRSMLSLTKVGPFPNLSIHPQRQYANDLPSKPPSSFDASTELLINVTFVHDSHGYTSVDLGVSGHGTSSKLRGRGLGANEMNRDVSFVEVFNRTYRRLRGHDDFITNKSKTISIEIIGRMMTTCTHVHGFNSRKPTTTRLNDGTTSEPVGRPCTDLDISGVPIVRLVIRHGGQWVDGIYKGVHPEELSHPIIKDNEDVDSARIEEYFDCGVMLFSNETATLEDNTATLEDNTASDEGNKNLFFASENRFDDNSYDGIDGWHDDSLDDDWLYDSDILICNNVEGETELVGGVDVEDVQGDDPTYN